MHTHQYLSAEKIDVTLLSLAQFEKIWQQHQHQWQESGPFVTPAWLKAWWSCFSAKNELMLLCVAKHGDVLGVAPFMIQGQVARFIGSEDLCDYLDILVLPEYNEEVFAALFNYFERNDISKLVLEPVKKTSSIITNLVPFARKFGCDVNIERKNVTVKMELPESWDEYLLSLSKKQRHEVRRKMRRFSEKGSVSTHLIREVEEADGAMNRFFTMFRVSRQDKDRFMTDERESFFRELARQLAHFSMLDVFQVDIKDTAAAMAFCVRYGATTYLYNNGFDPEYRSVSPGVVSKLMTIQHSIENGMKYYDFLSGNEHYKYQLGGVEEDLFSCSICMHN